eukprot:scaffold4647_cov393-Prasinococcus_capsulatus_cf.AAC.9
MENCTLAVEAAKKLKMSVVGIGGHDIAEGNMKLTLSILWQLMRYDAFQLLSSLTQNNKVVTDVDILGWANDKVAEAGKDIRVSSFKDKGPGSPTLAYCAPCAGTFPSGLSDGIFLLELMRVLDSRIVNWGLVRQSGSSDDKVRPVDAGWFPFTVYEYSQRLLAVLCPLRFRR